MDAPVKGQSKLLPKNAYTKLNPGEEYQPIVPAQDARSEVTLWSIGLGVIMVIVFSAACVYISLRAGNGIEASIPIAILAIFFGMTRKVKSTILENVMVQSVGQAAGVVAAGATFVIPALYINRYLEMPQQDQETVLQKVDLGSEWGWHIFFACLIGGILGTVLIVPLRKYFVKDLHGELPFPEATAINEVLVTGESSAGGAGKILILAFLLGAGFDFCIEALHLWNSELTTNALPWGLGESLAGLRIEVQILGIAALFGLGYIIGIKYASIIASGSVLAYVVMVPVVYMFGRNIGPFSYAGGNYDLILMDAHQTFGAFIKPVGIGAIAISGLIGIIRMGKIVLGSITLGFKGFSQKGQAAPTEKRTQLDMHPKYVLLVQLGATLAMGILFFIVAMNVQQADGSGYTLGESLLFALVGMFSGFLLSFLFTPVAAQAIAIVGVNPVSGMTLITVVLAIGTLILVGLKGSAGMIIALIVGTAVCTALSTSGALISDFKVGYWIGATPRNQQRWKFLGILVAAAVVALVIPLMNEAYQFIVKDPTSSAWVSNDKVLPAPQANMIAAVSKGLISDPSNQPWLLYALGGLVAFLLFMASVPMLAFALGMYLPISINMAVLAGAVCAWLISRTGKTKAEGQARAEQGNLIASGLMAGAAIFGIITAVLRLPGIGAPIQYLSLGVDYRMEAVVEGEVVKKDGKTVQSCQDLPSEKSAACNELLKSVPFLLDWEEKPSYDLEEIQKLKKDLETMLAAIEIIGTTSEEVVGLRWTALFQQGDELRSKLTALLEGESPQAPLVGARQLVSSANLLRISIENQPAGPERKPLLKAAQEALSLAIEIDRNLHPQRAHPWYQGGFGHGLGLLMLLALGFACYLLARKGASWQLSAPGSKTDP